MKSELFDKSFFKDYIESCDIALNSFCSVFEWMPGEFLDEEMVLCAFFHYCDLYHGVRNYYIAPWFRSIMRRRPELMREEIFIVCARIVEKMDKGVLLFLIPEEYKTNEFFAQLNA